MKNKIIVIDDFFPKNVFDKILKLFSELNWKYYKDCCIIDESLDSELIGENFTFSAFFDKMQLKQYEIDVKKYISNKLYINAFERGFLNIFPIQQKNIITTPHVNKSEDHIVSLFYMNDTDGKTFFYNETINEIPFSAIEMHGKKIVDAYNFTINKSISPRKNRMVFFDGSIYHAPEIPTICNRFTITAEFKGNFCKIKYE
jgi:hypothetical protein